MPTELSLYPTYKLTNKKYTLQLKKARLLRNIACFKEIVNSWNTYKNNAVSCYSESYQSATKQNKRHQIVELAKFDDLSKSNDWFYSITLDLILKNTKFIEMDTAVTKLHI